MIADLYKAFVFDLDGVIWLGKEAVPGAVEAVNKLKSLGKEVRFLTNNASKKRETTTRLLQGLGIETNNSEVITSGFATAKYLAKKFGNVDVYVLGTNELREEMREAGLNIVERNAEIVAVGLDREFNYSKLDQALQNIIVDGAKFVACNCDPAFPEKNATRPGAGSIVAALACCAGRQADIIVGKPSLPCYEIVLETLNLAAKDCLMVGDKIETDLSGGRNAGMSTALVLSGIGKAEDIKRLNFTPEHVIESVATIF